MEYFHGIKISEKSKPASAPVTTQSGVIFAIGTAPIQKTESIEGKSNTPILVNSFEEAKEIFGYSDDWDKFTLCEVMDAAFNVYDAGPIVMVNVLASIVSMDEKLYTIDDTKTIKLPEEAFAAHIWVDLTDAEKTRLEEGVDYNIQKTDDGVKIICLEGGKITEETKKLSVTYNMLQLSENDIVGGIDEYGTKSGLEAINDVFPKYGIVPDIIIAPRFSHLPEVAEAMTIKAENINGMFKAKAILDLDSAISKDDDDLYTPAEAIAYKKERGYDSKSQLVCWPPVIACGGKEYRFSTHQALAMAKTDKNADLGGGCPCETASNKTIKADGARYSYIRGFKINPNEAEALLDITAANLLNQNGIITTIRMMGNYVSWGNEAGCYPENQNPEEYLYSVSRMFEWVGKMIVLSVWSKVDRKMSRRLMESIAQSLNVWLNGLTAEEKILGGRVEFREEENSTEDLMRGRTKFHVYLTPPSPAREFDFVMEYAPEYLETLMEG